jgi:hypothetical protein
MRFALVGGSSRKGGRNDSGISHPARNPEVEGIYTYITHHFVFPSLVRPMSNPHVQSRERAEQVVRPPHHSSHRERCAGWALEIIAVHRLLTLDCSRQIRQLTAMRDIRSYELHTEAV